MGDFRDDIERYLKGEMTPAEMHALEKRALTDPFLADALEGAGSIPLEQFSMDLAGLRNKLQQRKVLTAFFTPFRMAASVGILMISLWIIYLFYKPDPPVTLAQHSQNSAAMDSSKMPETETGPSVQKKPEQPLAKASGSGLQRKGLQKADESKPITIAEAEEKSGQGAASGQIRDEEISTEKEKLTMELVKSDSNDDVRKKAVARKAQSVDKYELAASAPSKEKYPKIELKGWIISAEDGTPIAGANVYSPDSRLGTVSDAKGFFRFSTDNLMDSLQVEFIGLKTKRIGVPVTSDTIVVAMASDATSLSEVVTTQASGYDNGKSDKVSDQDALPEGGLAAFNLYIEKNLRYPSTALDHRIKGSVTIDITVQANRKISRTKIIRSLGYGCDEEAIRLIREGPTWSPAIKGGEKVSSTIRLVVRFKPPK